jgi:hypothetical protein
LEKIKDKGFDADLRGFFGFTQINILNVEYGRCESPEKKPME